MYQTVAGVTCRAASFNPSPTSTSSVSRMASSSPSSEAITSSDSNKAVTNVVIVLGVLTLIGIVASIMLVNKGPIFVSCNLSLFFSMVELWLV